MWSQRMDERNGLFFTHTHWMMQGWETRLDQAIYLFPIGQSDELTTCYSYWSAVRHLLLVVEQSEYEFKSTNPAQYSCL